MIPLRLSLRNFMCYSEDVPPISFEGFRVACLCGDNGAGKSALLDAITWALWGKARAKSDDQLIHTGQTEMEVSLEFLAGPQLQRYRVWRQRAKGKSGRSGHPLLELYSVSAEGHQALTGNTIGETERKIRDILRMDYDTFINSAFLMQGRADEFTLKPPSDRKRVLGDILGLSRYDELEERARERAREKAREQEALDLALDRLAQELARREEYEAGLRQAQEALEALEVRIREQETALESLQSAQRERDLKLAQQQEIDKRIQQIQRELSLGQENYRQQQARLGEHEKMLAEANQIEEGYQQLAACRQTEEKLSQSQSQLARLTEQKAKLERALAVARAELQTKEAAWRRQQEVAATKASQLTSLEKELLRAQEEEAKLSVLAEQLDQARQRAEEASQEIQHLKATNEKLKGERLELKEKLDLLARGDARCPLCERGLEPTDRARLQAMFESEGHQKAETYRHHQAEIWQREQDYMALRLELSQKEARLPQEKATRHGRVVALTKDIEAAQNAQAESLQAEEELRHLRERLAQENFALAEQEALKQVTADIDSLAYDAQAHQEARRRLTALATYDIRHHALQEARRLLPLEKAGLAQTEAQLGRAQQEWREAQEEKKRLLQALHALPDLSPQIEQAQGALRTLRPQREEAQRRLGAAQERLAHCLALEKEKAQRQRERDLAAEERATYEELAIAFGKKGIQALIIETALPEVETEANRLLGRMTEGRMTLSIETQRSTQKGDTVETLEILIGDEWGTRSYEMFSGGEAFRINFALRVALSRLLARRAGDPLPTLFIDEGFGTQDSTGRERIIEAIHSVEEDFEKIIVITHIEELKEVFPVRLEVTKTEKGSHVSLG